MDAERLETIKQFFGYPYGKEEGLDVRMAHELITALEVAEAGLKTTWATFKEAEELDQAEIARLNKELEAAQAKANITQGWHEQFKNVSRRNAELRAEIDRLKGDLERARDYKGIGIRACPLCKYDGGKFIERCEMHKQLLDKDNEILRLTNSS